MSTISDYVIFLLKLPYLLVTKPSLSVKASLATIILGALLLIPFIRPDLFSEEPLNISLYSFGIALGVLIVSRLWLEYTRNKGFKEPVLNPNYNYSKPTDIMRNLREDDKNSLMFGRSNSPTEPLSQNSGKSEILRGYMNSSTMGEQYGTFTGMTLYGGPDMYDQTVLSRVFDYDKYKIQGTIDLREVSQEIKDKIEEIKNTTEIEENKRLREELIELARGKDEIPKLVARCIDGDGNVDDSDEYCNQLTTVEESQAA